MADQLVAMLRDASWFDRPDTWSPKQYHVDAGNAIGACTGNPLAEFTAVPAVEVRANMRCQRPGCRVRWPN